MSNSFVADEFLCPLMSPPGMHLFVKMSVRNLRAPIKAVDKFIVIFGILGCL